MQSLSKRTRTVCRSWAEDSNGFETEADGENAVATLALSFEVNAHAGVGWVSLGQGLGLDWCVVTEGWLEGSWAS